MKLIKEAGFSDQPPRAENLLVHRVKAPAGLLSRRAGLILDGHGLMSFIIHPDYVIQNRPQAIYKALLEELNRLRSDHGVWVALPREVDRWWRERSEMKASSRQRRLENRGVRQ